MLRTVAVDALFAAAPSAILGGVALARWNLSPAFFVALAPILFVPILVVGPALLRRRRQPLRRTTV